MFHFKSELKSVIISFFSKWTCFTVRLIRFNNQFHFSEKSSQNKEMIVNYDGENLAPSSSDYRMPLVWIDLEMTGEFFIPSFIKHMLAGGWSLL